MRARSYFSTGTRRRGWLLSRSWGRGQLPRFIEKTRPDDLRWLRCVLDLQDRDVAQAWHRVVAIVIVIGDRQPGVQDNIMARAQWIRIGKHRQVLRRRITITRDRD